MCNFCEIFNFEILETISSQTNINDIFTSLVSNEPFKHKNNNTKHK